MVGAQECASDQSISMAREQWAWQGGRAPPVHAPPATCCWAWRWSATGSAAWARRSRLR